MAGLSVYVCSVYNTHYRVLHGGAFWPIQSQEMQCYVSMELQARRCPPRSSAMAARIHAAKVQGLRKGVSWMAEY